MRANYWTNTKIADIIRGTDKPNYLAMGEWDIWNKNAKAKHPIRYYIAEDLLGDLQDIINYIPDRINDVRCYLNNRFQHKTHCLVSNLPKGDFHEFETRLFHCMFDEFVNFIEVEKAYNYVVWNDSLKDKYAIPFTQRHWYTRWFSEWRCPEAGLACLDWEASLTNNEWYEKDHPDYGKPSPQAVSATEQQELYNWYKNIRPLRPDPYDASGWTDWCRHMDDKYPGSIFHDTKTPEEQKTSTSILKKMHKLEQQYDQEDEKMMIRLIKIRKGLWT